MNRKTIAGLILIIISLSCLSAARADDFYIGYLEGRLVLDGDRQKPWMSNFSDLATAFSGYTAGSYEVIVEGQYNIWGPISLGGKFLAQLPGWTDRDNFSIGPKIQLKFGWRLPHDVLLDITAKSALLIDLEEGFPGRTETSLITVLEWKRLSVIPMMHHFWTQDFNWNSMSHQLTSQVELTVWLWEQYIGVVFMPEYTRVWGLNQDGDLTTETGIFTPFVGLKSHIPLPANFSLWAIPLIGPQHHNETGWGFTFAAAIGVQKRF